MIEVLPLPKIHPVRSFAVRRLLERITESVLLARHLRDNNVRQSILWTALPFNQAKWSKSDWFSPRLDSHGRLHVRPKMPGKTLASQLTM